MPTKEALVLKDKTSKRDMWDIVSAYRFYGPVFKTMFLPSGNTIVMPTDQRAEVCRFARKVFPNLERIAIYGSSRYIVNP